MYWTQAALIFLSGICVGLNIVQLSVTRTVRWSGIMVCMAWALQETYNQRTGGDSIVLFILCDAVIVAWFIYSRRVWDIRDRLIAASIPFTTALGTYAWLRGAHTYESWWINFYIVAAQMVLGLPTPKFQRASGSVSHGTLRRAPSEGA